jgi:acyl-CoA synthetase (AMP-forming)/AMP-acid ligase II
VELEAVLLGHPQIIDAAVIGVYPSGVDGGEVPRGYVVRRPGAEGAKLTADEVKRYLGTRLARYKALEGGVVFVDVIPKNASGKILKKTLREQAKREMGSKM